jgi:hypothetical protein
MNSRTHIQALFQHATDEFTGCNEFSALEAGSARRRDYDRFIVNFLRTHLRSQQLLAFLFSIAPPEASNLARQRIIDELGPQGTSLLHKLADAASLSPLMVELEDQAVEDVRRIVVDPMLYPSLREVAFGALVEFEAFQYFLSRIGGRIAGALTRHRKLPPAAVMWFNRFSHINLDQSFTMLEDYLAYYEITPGHAQTIAEVTLRENVFIKRYFGLNSFGEPISNEVREG